MHTSLFHEEAQRRVFLGFYIHLATFVVVNVALGMMNFLQNPDRPWFLWVVGGWGIGVLLHAFLVYHPQSRERGVHRVAERLERREARQRRREDRRESEVR